MAFNCAFFAVLAQGGRWSLKLDILTHFAPIWLAGGLAALVCSVFLPAGAARVSGLALSLVAVASAASLIAPEYLRPMSPKAPADAARQIKLIQFNAWGRAQAKVDTDWLLAQDADFIVMQESTAPVRAAILASGRYHMAPRSSTVAVFSKQPPIPVRYNWPKAVIDWPPIAHGTYRASEGDFDVVSMHATWPGWLQREQGRALAALVAQRRQDRLIISGDFNSTPWSFSRRREDKMYGLERRTRALFSWPAAGMGPIRPPFPILPIDHVYAGSAWRTVSVTRGPFIGSDHYPVIVVLALKD
jgi:endonuclease/exonuclease/phosphatase (EEP) superfamily protein YafD